MTNYVQPVIRTLSADGQLHEFPPGTPSDVVDKAMADYAASKQPPNSAVDSARAIPGGLAKGAAMIAGLPGDALNLINAGAKGIASLLPEPSQDLQTRAVQAKILDPAESGPAQPAPGSADIAEGIAKPFGGYYQPQTTAGKYAETIASFAPAALAPGGVARRLANVVIPGAASEAAGQATEGTSLEPYARTGAALLAGGGVGLGGQLLKERAATAAVPTSAALRSSASNSYKDVANQGVVISGKSFDNAIGDIHSELEQKAGFNSRIPDSALQRLYPKASAALDVLNASKGADISLPDLDTLRKTANVALSSNDKADRRVAHIIIDGIDDFVNKLQPADVVAGDAPAATASLNNARDLWQRAARGDVIERAIQKAQDSSSQFTGSGYENALRVQFRGLAKNDGVMRQFSAPEQAAIRKVANGGPVENTLRFLGKFSPHGASSTMMTGGAGYAVGGPVGAAASLAGGEAARQAATALTSRNARLASEMVRSGSGAAPSLVAPATNNALQSFALQFARRNQANDNSPYASRSLLDGLRAAMAGAQ